MAILVNNNGGGENEVINDFVTTDFTPQPAEPVASESSSAVMGLSSEEQSDPNKIIVTVTDPNTPIVVLYGPPSCGKTMTLVRMTRFLKSQGYRVEPEKTFRPARDAHYKQLCDDFNMMINSNNAATSTSNISFMLVKVMDNRGKPICQILEAPGEYYFNPEKPNNPYPAYVNRIFDSTTNRKIVAIMVEPDWDDFESRANYVSRISELKSRLGGGDKVVFVYNKIDKTHFVDAPGQVNLGEAIKNVQNLYPNIFVPFKNQNPITRFFKAYNCEFVPFMTGSYSETMDGELTFTEGHPNYARKFWQTMLNLIKG